MLIAYEIPADRFVYDLAIFARFETSAAAAYYAVHRRFADYVL